MACEDGSISFANVASLSFIYHVGCWRYIIDRGTYNCLFSQSRIGSWVDLTFMSGSFGITNQDLSHHRLPLYRCRVARHSTVRHMVSPSYVMNRPKLSISKRAPMYARFIFWHNRSCSTWYLIERRQSGRSPDRSSRTHASTPVTQGSDQTVGFS
jgi:hypothetical protein